MSADVLDGSQPSPVDPAACPAGDRFAVQFRDDDWNPGHPTGSSVAVYTGRRAADGKWDVDDVDRWRYHDEELIVLRGV